MIKTIKTYSSLFRVDNYIKNLFIFAPLFFGFQFDIGTIKNAFISFVLFCLIASSVYIFNDIFDLKSDQKHPVKKLRPLPSGAISVKKAFVIGILLMLISLTITYMVNTALFYVFISYLIINVFYNLYLKKVPIIDVLLISFGFVLRILAGSYATDISASSWILIMTFLLSLFLGFSKRRADVVLANANGLKAQNIRIFSVIAIDRIIFSLATIIGITYTFYTISKEVIDRVGSSFVFITSIWVIVGIIRYIRVVRSSKKYKDPTAIVIGDWKLQCIILLWISSFIILKYI
ncbi:UbiA prenyltransferase family protein [uncultured Aquimarina sp.]|uniref:UbiA prenyltransferase family protein n=1 Tax=uncultured Aquimarina sp. TaxID=575652 RepID=UPI00262AA623|nr:UbiA prenyltransferase family protein [uncultured Aquimarina sp.]